MNQDDDLVGCITIILLMIPFVLLGLLVLAVTK